VFSTRLALFQGTTVENRGKGNPETGFKSPPEQRRKFRLKILHSFEVSRGVVFVPVRFPRIVFQKPSYIHFFSLDYRTLESALKQMPDYLMAAIKVLTP
jgi:hypothetical protein